MINFTKENMVIIMAAIAIIGVVFRKELAERKYTYYIEKEENLKENYYKRSEIRDDLKNYYGAINDLDEVIKIDNTERKAYLERARLKYYSSDYYKLLEDINWAINLDTSDVYAYLLKGKILNQLGQYEYAIKYFDTVMTKDKHSIWLESAYFNRGYSKKRLGDKKGAFEDMMISDGIKMNEED